MHSAKRLGLLAAEVDGDVLVGDASPLDEGLQFGRHLRLGGTDHLTAARLVGHDEDGLLAACEEGSDRVGFAP